MAIRDDAGDGIYLGAVLRVGGTVFAAHGDEALAVDAEAIVGVEIDLPLEAVLGPGAGQRWVTDTLGCMSAVPGGTSSGTLKPAVAVTSTTSSPSPSRGERLSRACSGM